MGKWWDDSALNERHWVFLIVKPTPANFNMTFEEPECSRHVNFKPLGIALSRDEVLLSDLKDAFFSVADYIVVEDPAVLCELPGRRFWRLFILSFRQSTSWPAESASESDSCTTRRPTNTCHMFKVSGVGYIDCGVRMPHYYKGWRWR